MTEIEGLYHLTSHDIKQIKEAFECLESEYRLSFDDCTTLKKLKITI